MEKQSKNEFQIKLERETRKRLIKLVLSVIIPTYVLIFYLFALVARDSGHDIAWVLLSQVPLTIFVIAICVLLIPFLWFMYKSEVKSKVYDDMFKDFSKSLVDKMLVPDVPVKVGLIKARGVIYGDFILDLQYDAADFYAVLGEKDNLICIYAVFKEEDEKRKLDVISKEEFSEYYQLLDK